MVDKVVPVEEGKDLPEVGDRGVHLVVGVAEEISKEHHTTISSSQCLTEVVEAEVEAQGGITRNSRGIRTSLLITMLQTRGFLTVLMVVKKKIFLGILVVRGEGKCISTVQTLI